MRRLLPILLILLGLGGGIGAGWFLKPPPAEKTGDAVDADGQNGGDENTKEKGIIYQSHISSCPDCESGLY